MVVQELVCPSDCEPPSLLVEELELEQLLELTELYQQRLEESRRRRQLDDRGGVYIAANLTMEELVSAFVLGDAMDHGGFTNHQLQPGRFYNVTLRGTGTDTAVFYTSEERVCKFSR